MSSHFWVWRQIWSRPETESSVTHARFQEVGIVPKFLLGEAIVFLICLLAEVISLISAAVLFVLMALWALKGKKAAIQIVSLSLPLFFANPGVISPLSAITLFKWIVIICASVSITTRSFRQVRFSGWTKSLFFFLIILVGLSAASSEDPAISLSKVLTFTLGLMIALFGFHDGATRKQYWLDWFFTLHCCVLVCSLFLVMSPLGYLRNGRGFQGILQHPQAFAVYLIPFTGYLIGRVIGGEKLSAINRIILVLGIVALVLSQARTAVVALAIGMLMSLMATLIWKRGSSGRYLRSMITLVWLLVFSVGSILVMITNRAIGEGVISFVLKDSNPTTPRFTRVLTESFSESRGKLLDKSWSCFERSPWTGTGFGVDPDGEYPFVERDPVFGIPISAPYETGFILTSVLGQIGMIGAFGLLVFLSMYSMPLLRRLSFSLGVLCWTALAVNLGEMIFFSTGGLGMQMWLVLGLCEAQIYSNKGSRNVR